MNSSIIKWDVAGVIMQVETVMGTQQRQSLRTEVTMEDFL